MSDMNSIAPKADRALLPRPQSRVPEDPKQRKLMVGSLCLLLFALSIVLWHDRDFWFPDAPEAESGQPVETSPAATVRAAQVPAVPSPTPPSRTKHRVATAATAAAAPTPTPQPSSPPMATTTTRTVLPPLEVEVVAGDSHRTIRPGSSSVRVDLQPGTTPQPAPEASATREAEVAANVTTNAADRVQMSADTSDIVARPVRPSYPLLARQMKVQGSVILQALISKDGVIQNLRVVSGPHILASAAQDAVRQWHFKPHFEGSEAVETQAKITVNFTISTN
jgi:protein TonB